MRTTFREKVKAGVTEEANFETIFSEEVFHSRRSSIANTKGPKSLPFFVREFRYLNTVKRLEKEMEMVKKEAIKSLNQSDFDDLLKLCPSNMPITGLCDFLEDDDGLFKMTSPDPSNENVQIVFKEGTIELYLGGQHWMSSKVLVEVLWAGILIHPVFQIEFPESFKNLAIALIKRSDNNCLLSKDEKLPKRIQKKLEGKKFL